MTLFSDGIAARLLVVNLIRALELQGVLDSSTTDQIFDKSTSQASGFMQRLVNDDDETSNTEPNAALSDLERTSIENAINMLKTNLTELKNVRKKPTV
jgi:hypothetical protein